MKKLTLILALAMLALFTQCKKQDHAQDIPTNGIQMVLTADNGGSKTSFGANGSISWNTKEKIYVVTGGQCVGYVTNGTEGGNTFTGTLTGITADGTYDFHYYYVGNTQTIANDATSFTMDFSNQDGTLDNLGYFHVGYGVQNGVEVTVGTPVTAQTSMKSLVSMAYFDLAGMAEAGEKVYFYGDNINNQMTIDFSTNAPTYGKANEGGQNLICAGTVATGSTSPCYVMLLPNHNDGTEELTTNITFISKRTTGTCNDVFNYGIVGGMFYCNGGNTESPIPVAAASYYPGTLRCVFSIGDNKTMHFSQGNLQYNITTAVWSFMEHQYDVVETYGQDVGTNYADQNIVSLFGWGTSGWNNGNMYYQPYNTEQFWDSETGNGYGPTDGTNYNYDLTGDYANADWGVYNAIANGGNTPNQWRTLTVNEWDYVFNARTTPSGIRYAKGIVKGINGVILLPDDWNTSIHALNYTNRIDAPFTTNTIDTDWTMMESAGAVFLPVACHRDGTYVNVDYGGVAHGYYWSTSYDAIFKYNASYVFFNNEYLNPNYYSGLINQSSGLSVRLVRDVE